jgi:acetyl esterase/lipase
MNPTAASSIADAVRALGFHFDLEVLTATLDIYRPHISLPAGPSLADQAYGPHPRQRLDVYLPRGGARGIVIYVHGGGFVRGDKNLDGVFYANLGQFFADHGYAAVLPNYRRAPDFPWPSGARDVQSSIEWVCIETQTGRFGRTSLPIFVLGQSAGASHVASWLFDAEARGAVLDEPAGVLLMSGFYCARAPLADNVAAYFGREASSYAERSPLSHVKPCRTPLWISVAELDPGRIATHSFELAQAIAGHNGKSPEFAWLRGHNHVSTVLSLGSPQQDAGAEILRFLGAHS